MTLLRKHPRPGERHVLPRDEAAWSRFTWAAARAELDGLPGGGLNMAHEAVDRHAARRGDDEALRILDPHGGRRSLNWHDLAANTARFANLLHALGLARGETVFAALGRCEALYAAALGTLKAGGVFSALFPGFGPEPMATRLDAGRARVLVTTDSVYRRKIAPQRSALKRLEHVFLVDVADAEAPEGARGLADALAAMPDTAATAPTTPGDPALLQFTSGTTGMPKGAVHAHEALVAQLATARWTFDLAPGDIYWCTADPGWITGLVYGVVAPLAAGATVVVDTGDFDPVRWWSILASERVQVWYTAPTAIRMLRRAGGDLARRHDTSALRLAASVGEPLDPASVRWGVEAIGRPFHDTWWQTETGAIMIANVPARDIKPGSMGRPLPGIEAAIARREEDGGLSLLDEPDAVGELVLRAGWPSMFRDYLGAPERYAASFRDGWYLTGDLARRDKDGDFWFVGRADDVIKTSGHMVGPTEVEGVLLGHEGVADAGVVGRPDPVAGETVVAFVVPARGLEPDGALRRAIMAHARRRLGAALAPRQIIFRDALPKTRSGKIMRRMLREQLTQESSADGAEEQG